MRRLQILLICFTLIVVGCDSSPIAREGIVTRKEYQESTWGIGIGQIGKGNIGAVAELYPEQYLITVFVLDQEEVFSVEQGIYEQISVGDTVACEGSDSFFTCTFEED